MQIPGFKESALVIEDFLKQIIAEGDFYIKVPTKVLPLILECGYLKTLCKLENSKWRWTCCQN